MDLRLHLEMGQEDCYRGYQVSELLVSALGDELGDELGDTITYQNMVDQSMSSARL